jgi:hypothetical protein
MGWMMYPEDLQERYKVLQALQISRDRSIYGPSYNESYDQRSKRVRIKGRNKIGWNEAYVEWGCTNWNQAVAGLIYCWKNTEDFGWGEFTGSLFVHYGYYPIKYLAWLWEYPTNYYRYEIEASATWITNTWTTKVFPDEINHLTEFWCKPATSNAATVSGDFEGYSITPTILNTIDLNGFPTVAAGWHLLTTDANGWTTNQYNTNGWEVAWGFNYNTNTPPPQCTQPIKNVSQQVTGSSEMWNSTSIWSTARGGPVFENEAEIYRWQFNYCTEKYW